ncbi:MAG: hypothetical protein MI919_00650 [Holophagales bacterium]|nr:hypothetical protein [Holophagales bacterium]
MAAFFKGSALVDIIVLSHLITPRRGRGSRADEKKWTSPDAGEAARGTVEPEGEFYLSAFAELPAWRNL